MVLLLREQPLMPGGLEVSGGPQGRVAQVAGEGSGVAHTGAAQRMGGAVWSSWREILGIWSGLVWISLEQC